MEYLSIVYYFIIIIMIRKIYRYIFGEEENPEVVAKREEIKHIRWDYHRTLNYPPEIREEYVKKLVDNIIMYNEKSSAESRDLRIAEELAQREAKLSQEERSTILREKKNI